jgi:predicted RNase H-like nuclease (RuvC/YqgF family)
MPQTQTEVAFKQKPNFIAQVPHSNAPPTNMDIPMENSTPIKSMHAAKPSLTPKLKKEVAEAAAMEEARREIINLKSQLQAKDDQINNLQRLHLGAQPISGSSSLKSTMLEDELKKERLKNDELIRKIEDMKATIEVLERPQRTSVGIVSNSMLHNKDYASLQEKNDLLEKSLQEARGKIESLKRDNALLESKQVFFTNVA